MKQFEIGEEIETTVVQVSADTVFIDLGLKSEGFVERSEFVDEDGNCSVKEGDKIKVFFVSSNRDELKFTTKLKSEDAGSELLQKAYDSSLAIEGHVEKEIKGGFEVKIGGARAFCPYSQMGYKNRLEMSEYVGRTVTFVITEFKNEGKNIIVSNRKIEEKIESDKIENLSHNLEVGSIVEGTVKSLQSYGAFVDVQGFQTLLPISEISFKRTDDISQVLSVGQTVKAKVIKADWNGERSKVSISMKSLETDPWNNISSNLKVGQKMSGTIVRIQGFGIFVNILPGIDGLVHVSQIEGISANTNLAKKFKIGEKFDVVVQKIEAKEKRISLSPATSKEQDNDAAKYMADQQDDGDSYNPFAALLKK